jgi:hypothetical protein
MSPAVRRSVLAGLAVVLSATLVGCAPTPAPAASPSGTASPSAAEDAPRFIIECVGLDGSAIGPFTRLEEAWASTNYVRIDHCSASAAPDRPVELTPQEQNVAETAAADVPDEDPVELFLWTLATCVRVAPTSEQGLSTLPVSLLRATLELCPEAPHAGLVEDELEARDPS